MNNTLIIGGVVILIIGLIMFAKSNKHRGDNGEWSSSLQWGYLLMMVGIFGILSSFMSFTAVLLVFVIITGVLWGIHKRRLKKAAAQSTVDNHHFSDYMSSFFPIILVVFVLRTFVAEPFQIPSSSMRPGLIVGDFILVNKFSYGIRVPILNKVIIPVGEIQRGDVVVFNYPENPQINYIKRAIGLPGDVIEYKNKELIINGQTITDEDIGKQNYIESVEDTSMSPLVNVKAYQEKLGDHSFSIFQMDDRPSFFTNGVRSNFPYRNNCEYADDGSWFKCTVPEGHYFMMGDNRDNSEDSRYWGFVSDKLIVGKAFLIWMNFKDMSRLGTHIE